LAGRITGIRVRRRHRREPADRRRSYENVGGTKSAHRRRRLCGRRRPGAGEPRPDSLAGSVCARAQLSGRFTARGASELERRQAVRDRQGHHHGRDGQLTYNEFLPHLLGADAIQPYHGYDPSVDARITEEFAGAAFRFGHSIVSDEISAISNLGEFTSEQTLAGSFFEDTATFNATGADGLLRHLAGDLANLLDAHLVDGLRNLLFDPPAGIDLAAINIQRGHDLGLGTLNQTRAALGLAPYTSFDQLSSDPETAAAFKQAYGSINAVDLWAGGLAEDHAEGAIIGPTFGKIIGDQFTALRDGDRFYFENQKFDSQTLKEIKSTTLSDLILRDTDTTAMQSDAFVATERHSGTLGGVDPTGAEAADGMAQLVVGSPGTDSLTGGDLDDTLVAAAGHMTMWGGDGADTFVFNLDYLKGQNNTATITDFDPNLDRLQILNEDYVKESSDHHGGILLQLGNETIDLLGVKPNELHHHDWIASSGTTTPQGGQGFGWWGQLPDSVTSGQTPATGTSTGGLAGQGSATPHANGSTASSLASQSFALLNQYLASNSGRVDPGQIVAAVSNGATWGQDSFLTRPQH
jgi:peroxidase